MTGFFEKSMAPVLENAARSQAESAASLKRVAALLEERARTPSPPPPPPPTPGPSFLDAEVSKPQARHSNSNGTGADETPTSANDVGDTAAGKPRLGKALASQFARDPLGTIAWGLDQFFKIQAQRQLAENPFAYAYALKAKDPAMAAMAALILNPQPLAELIPGMMAENTMKTWQQSANATVRAMRQAGYTITAPGGSPDASPGPYSPPPGAIPPGGRAGPNPPFGPGSGTSGEPGAGLPNTPPKRPEWLPNGPQQTPGPTPTASMDKRPFSSFGGLRR